MTTQELSEFQVLTDEEIREALRKGREEAEAWRMLW